MIRTLLLAAATVALAACAVDEGAEAETAAASPAAMPTGRAAYVDMAAASDRFEIQSSDLALTRSKDEAVRQFAQMMIDHHRGTTERLRAAAKTAGMLRTHDWMLPPPMQEKVEALQKASDAEFDGLYLRQQVEAHEAALALHSHYARRGDTAALRAVAAAAVVVVRQHLERARQLGRS